MGHASAHFDYVIDKGKTPLALFRRESRKRQIYLPFVQRITFIRQMLLKCWPARSSAAIVLFNLCKYTLFPCYLCV